MTRPVPAHGRLAAHGMVTTVDHVATGVGVELLRRGGSAADAAVAASAVLAVTTQHQCGMGGDLFAVVHPGDGEPEALVAAGRTGSGADLAALRAEGHDVVPFRGDVRATPVPGCVDGWLALHERFGRLPLADVLGPARQLAERGFAATATLAGAVQLLDGVAHADAYRPGGVPVRPGGLVRRPGVARALAAIVADGREGFYGGEFGAGLVALGDGLFTPDDLATSDAAWAPALRAPAWGHDVWTVPPPSQGYLTLAAAVIASGLPLPDDPDDPVWAHLLVEAAVQAAHDRVAALHEHADGAALLDPVRLDTRRAAIDPARASRPGGRFRDGGTIHLNAVDAHGQAVSLTQSNAAGFGAHVVEPSTGIFLQNRGIGFSLDPAHPAAYGPRRRPPHTLSPALVTRPDGRARLVLGTMGADSQPQVLLQLLARILVSGQAPADAVAAPRWVLGSPTDETFRVWDDPASVRVRVEADAPAAWVGGLRARGHEVVDLPPCSPVTGHAHVVLVDDDHLAGAADPRAEASSAAGW